MSVNKVILVGRLGQNPELRFTGNNTPVCSLNLATTERRKDASGTWNDFTEWHKIVVYGKTAENCAQYLQKGREVYVEGRIQTRKWQDKEGRDRYTTEVVAAIVQFLGSGAGRNQGVSAASGAGAADGGSDVMANMDASDSSSSTSASPESTFSDDDIPF